MDEPEAIGRALRRIGIDGPLVAQLLVQTETKEPEMERTMEADLRDMTSDILRSALAAAEVAQRDGEDAMAAATAVAAAGLAALGMVRAVWPAAADANPQAGT